MPTPISSARQCLAGDAARALDDAVAVARRRAHAQTTSLHVVSALLSSSASSPSSSSILKDALGRARSVAYPPRLQFKALELCFGVALDRLPSSAHHPPQSSPPEEPPVSNSLMAAIKRSQANQRRNPDTFHLYQQQQQQQQGGFAGLKVELQQLVLAILDDPVVSRVFGEAGFRSCDIKRAVLRPPPPPILRFPRAARCPPLFLCNLTPSSEGIPFPFPAAHLFPDTGEENCRRVGEVLARKATGRNPILVGVGAAEATKDFTRAVERQNWDFLPLEIRGVKLLSIAKELADGSWNVTRVEELARQAGDPGIVVSLGDLKELAENRGGRCDGVVLELKKLLELNRGRVWVMGWSATYETYIQLLSSYPSLDKDWDLHLLPITSARAGSGGLQPRPHSFIESFIPFGGFFPAAYESKYLLNSPSKLVSCCQHCNDKYAQELAALMKGCSSPVDTKHQANLPSWMRNSETCSLKDGLDMGKAADDKTALTAKVMDLQKKWNDYCQRVHCSFEILEIENHQVVPPVVRLPHVSDKPGSSNQICRSPDLNQDQSPCGRQCSISDDSHITSANRSISLPTISELNKNFVSEIQIRPSRSEQFQREGFNCQTGALSEGLPDGDASPSSVTSVTTDLVLGTPLGTPRSEERPASQAHREHLPGKKTDESSTISVALVKSHSCSVFPETLAKGTYLPTRNLPDSRDMSAGLSTFGHWSQSSLCMSEKFDPRDYKMLFRSLIERVGWQEEAIGTISQAIARCKSGHERHRGASLKGDIWLHFLGPDKVGKKRIAGTLAELMYGCKESFVCIDLSFHGAIIHPTTICDQQEINAYDVKFRGKTVTDHIAGEVSKKPGSIVLLENVDKADSLVQDSLSQAIRTGKISDSHGRAFSINNNIFVTTSGMDQGWTSSRSKGYIKFSEERILAAQAWQMKIIIEPKLDLVSGSPNASVLITSRKETGNRQKFPCTVFVSKRKLDVSADCTEQHESLGTSKRVHKTLNTFLDLNLPVEELVAKATDSSNTVEKYSVSDNSEAWLEEFLESMDETVKFKPFDFDALADSLIKEIGKILHSTIGSDCNLEIDVRVMEQILAATWLLEDKNALNNWFTRVLCRSFIEVKRRYNLIANSVLRLASCEDAVMEEQAQGILLPSRIVFE